MGIGGGVTADRFRTVANPGFDPKKKFRTSSGKMATVNPRQRTGYNPSFSPFGARGGGGGGGTGGGGRGGVRVPGQPAGQFSTGGGAQWGGGGMPWGGGGAGGARGAGGAPRPTEEIKLTAAPSPQMQQAQQQWEQQAAWLRQQAETTDANLKEQINLYRERMGEGPTTRAIERASSGIRDFAAGQAAEAERMGAMGGRGQGFGAAGLSESAQRAQAGAAANIALGREGQLDQLLASGTQIMGAPAQQRLAYGGLGTQHFGSSPYGEAAGLGLAEKQLGLQAWMAPRELGIREMEAQTRAQGSPVDWYRMLFS